MRFHEGLPSTNISIYIKSLLEAQDEKKMYGLLILKHRCYSTFLDCISKAHFLNRRELRTRPLKEGIIQGPLQDKEKVKTRKEGEGCSELFPGTGDHDHQ